MIHHRHCPSNSALQEIDFGNIHQQSLIDSMYAYQKKKKGEASKQQQPPVVL